MRSDHVHAHGDQPGGTLHNVATTTTAGFIAPADQEVLEELSVNGAGDVALTTSLDLGNNDITNVNLVDGVDVSDHGDRHLPNGADALATDTAVTIGTTNQEGTANSFARSDHVHAHGDQPGGLLHDLVTTSTAGFMSPVDKDKLDNIPDDNGPFTPDKVQAIISGTADTILNLDIAIGGGSSTKAIVFDTETVDTNNNYNSTSGIFTASTEGYYYVSTKFGLNTNLSIAIAGSFNFGVQVNSGSGFNFEPGLSEENELSLLSANLDDDFSFAGIVPLRVNDQLRVATERTALVSVTAGATILGNSARKSVVLHDIVIYEDM